MIGQEQTIKEDIRSKGLLTFAVVKRGRCNLHFCFRTRRIPEALELILACQDRKSRGLRKLNGYSANRKILVKK